MAIDSLIMTLPKAGKCVAHGNATSGAPSLVFQDESDNPFSEFLTLYLPRGADPILAQIIAEAFNHALETAPPKD